MGNRKVALRRPTASPFASNTHDEDETNMGLVATFLSTPVVFVLVRGAENDPEANQPARVMGSKTFVIRVPQSTPCLHEFHQANA